MFICAEHSNSNGFILLFSFRSYYDLKLDLKLDYGLVCLGVVCINCQLKSEFSCSKI
jgi:hypothetical protein